MLLLLLLFFFFLFFFFNDTATTEIYTLSLHDALPIWGYACFNRIRIPTPTSTASRKEARVPTRKRSEEHTSELQSRLHLVCRLLLEKKKKKRTYPKTQQERRPYNNTIETPESFRAYAA